MKYLADKIKELDLAEWLQKLFTNTAAHSALLRQAFHYSKGEREEDEEEVGERGGTPGERLPMSD